MNIPDSDTNPKCPSLICICLGLNPAEASLSAAGCGEGISSTVLGTAPNTADLLMRTPRLSRGCFTLRGGCSRRATKNCMKAPSCAMLPNAEACWSSNDPPEKSNRASGISLYVVWGSSERRPCFAPHPPPPLTTLHQHFIFRGQYLGLRTNTTELGVSSCDPISYVIQIFIPVHWVLPLLFYLTSFLGQKYLFWLSE